MGRRTISYSKLRELHGLMSDQVEALGGLLDTAEERYQNGGSSDMPKTGISEDAAMAQARAMHEKFPMLRRI